NLELKGGRAGESFLREQTARVRKRNQNQDACEEAEGSRNNPRHKPAALQQPAGSEVRSHLAPLPRRHETQAAMVLQANTEVPPKGDGATRRQVVRHVPPRNLQKRVTNLLLASTFGKKPSQGQTKDKESEANGTDRPSLS